MHHLPMTGIIPLAPKLSSLSTVVRPVREPATIKVVSTGPESMRVTFEH